MRITFLGSSHGVPEPNRRCSCTLIETGDKKYLIDAGTDPIQGLTNLGIHPDRLTAVFVTHMHGDHTDGLVPLCDLLSWYYKNANPVFYIPKPEIKEGIAAYLSYIKKNLRPELEFKPIGDGLFYDDGTAKITSFRTGHTDLSYSYLIEAEGKKVLFTGDMQHKDGPIADYARISAGIKLDLAVAECAHFSGTLYADALTENPPKLFCFNHYSDKFIASCLELKKAVAEKVPVIFATDGKRIDV